MAMTATRRGLRPLPLLLLLLAARAGADRARAADSASQECTAAASAKEDGACTAPSSSVYVIGDLHGDAICATSWVNRTGLIANLLDEDILETLPLFERLSVPSTWKWTNDNSQLVFMGDYVDKGPTSRQTVEFVRNLTVAFPDRVTAILGNHELELLRDRDRRILPYNRYSSYSYATVHPGEYHNYFSAHREGKTEGESNEQDAASEPRSLDDKDELVLDLLYEAGMEVYTHRAHSAVRFVPSLPEHSDGHKRRGIQYAITDVIPPEHRLLARERLAEYIDMYLDSFRSGTVLGDWVESRPIVHLAEDINTLFVHGGVSHDVGTSYLAKGKEGVETLNAVWWEHSHEGKLYDFLNNGESRFGEVVYDLLTYRGNHPGYGNWGSHGSYDEPTEEEELQLCKTLNDMLAQMEGIDRIAVGHTPDDEIRIICDGRFLALDSTLGRWIRGSGNEYCPGPEHLEDRKAKGVTLPTSSRDGRYTCEEIREVCEGQIVRLDSDGSVNILTH